MKTISEPIRKIVGYLNNTDHDGGFWLPNIQRSFVWSEEQITRLFDSILREYPISTLLVWKTNSKIPRRKFIDNYQRSLSLKGYVVPPDGQKKLLVLDGQQRLQSLLIGLRGSFEGRELYFDILSGTDTAPDDVKYSFRFLTSENAQGTWIKFKELVASNEKQSEARDRLVESFASGGKILTAPEVKQVEANVEAVFQTFRDRDPIIYQELDSIERPKLYTEDDVVEIFIRANSGGTKLSKSDLLFSLLISSWEDADGAIEGLLEELNQGDFAFDRDFILKCCLTVLGKGARYDVGKFRDGTTKGEIFNNWQAISDAIKGVRDFVVSKTYIRSDKALPSNLALIPLIYYRYHYPRKFAGNSDLAEYLLRSLVTGVFGGSPDNLIDKIVRNVQEKQDFILSEVFGVIRADNRSLEITPDVIFDQYYGSRTIHLFFNLWYRDFDYTPALDANGPQIDHIFPQSLLKTVKDINPDSGNQNILHYRSGQRDQIANCMLLTAVENGFSGKCDTPPYKWFDKSRFNNEEDQVRYLKLHLIPSDPELWKLNNFDRFVEARKVLIAEKFSRMLRPIGVGA
jgi:hypothetical protein